MAQMNGKVYDSIATMNKNWAAFVNRRLKEDLAMPQQLAACKTVQDMYGVYAEFFQTAVADYQSEFEQMTKLGKSLADDTVQVDAGAHGRDARERAAQLTLARRPLASPMRRAPERDFGRAQCALRR